MAIINVAMHESSHDNNDLFGATMVRIIAIYKLTQQFLLFFYDRDISSFFAIQCIEFAG